MRRRLFEIIELSDDDDRPGIIYDAIMLIAIIISIIPLAFKESPPPFSVSNLITAMIFVALPSGVITAGYMDVIKRTT